MDELDKLANILLFQEIHIERLVKTIEMKFPGKTLGDMIIESIFL
jgi:hypothetical protein